MDICLRETRLWYVRAIWVQILQKTLVEECIGEINVRKGFWCRAILRPDVTLDFGLVYVHCVCFGNRILQKTLGGFTNMLWETVWGG